MEMDKPDSVVIPHITLELHTTGRIERQEITCTLVFYAATLTSFTKVLPCYRALNMEATLEWNDKEDRICCSRHNLK